MSADSTSYSGAITSKPPREYAADSTGATEERVAAFCSSMDQWVGHDGGFRRDCQKATYDGRRPSNPSSPIYYSALATACIRAAAGPMPVRFRVLMEVLGTMATALEQFINQAGWQSLYPPSSFWRIRDSVLVAYEATKGVTIATLAAGQLEEEGDERLKAVAGRLAKCREEFNRV